MMRRHPLDTAQASATPDPDTSMPAMPADASLPRQGLHVNADTVAAAAAAAAAADLPGHCHVHANQPANPEHVRQAAEEGAGLNWETFRFGAFKFTSKKPGAQVQWSWQVKCPFHKKSQKTDCKKTMNVTPVTQDKYDEVIRCLKHWCNAARRFDRQRHHVAVSVDIAACPPAALIEASLIPASDIPPAVETDEVLDAREQQQQHVPKARAMPKQKSKSKPKAKAKSKSEAKAKAGKGRGRAGARGRARGRGLDSQPMSPMSAMNEAASDPPTLPSDVSADSSAESESSSTSSSSSSASDSES